MLLKDDGGVLPLSPQRGPEHRGDRQRRRQAYALTSGGGSAGVIPPYVVTPVQGITKRAAVSGARVSYAQGDIPVQGR